MATQHPETERTPARGRRSEHLLPGRPAAEDDSAGPVPDPGDPRRAKYPVRAITCSGGGIRAAAFALGGLQTLNDTTDEQEPTETFYGRTDLVCAVSGGSYIASSYALLEQGRRADEHPLTYAPGSPEDARLRAHTRYLIDSKTQLSLSLLGVVYGLVMNLLPFLAAAYVLAQLLGLVLGRHALGLLRVTPNGRGWSMAYPPPLYWTIVGVACAGALVYLVLRLVDTYRSVGQLVATRYGILALSLLAAAGVGAVLFLGVPALLEVVGRLPGRIRTVSWSATAGTIGGLVTTLLPVVQGIVRGSSGAKSGGQQPALGRRVLDKLLPWVGSVLVVLVAVVAVLAWTWNAALGHDSTARWVGVGGAALGVLLWQTLTDVNRTSLHRVYAQRLATAFGVRRDGFEPTSTESRLSRFGRGPRLVICATANTDQPGVVPTGRGCAPFTFSPDYAGISSGAMFRGGGAVRTNSAWLAEREFGDPVRAAWNAELRAESGTTVTGLGMTTEDLEICGNGMTLMDMVAVSGAAVSPAMGRMTRPSLRLVLGVANVRLGMWVPNPMHPRWAADADCTGWVQRLRRQLRQPGLLALWREIIGGITLNGAWLYVTDGGHYENLGLVEALRRGATEIVVLDASGDRPFTLSTFGEAVETARADLGVEVVLDHPNVLAEVKKTGRAASLAAHATATYANGVQADIYLCKAAMVDGLPLDVEAWHGGHPAFPNDSTGNQLYGDREFEAYRRLGQAAAGQALGLMPSHPVAVHDGRPPRDDLGRQAVSL